MQWPLRAVRTIRHGAATTEIAKGPSVPKVQTKSALAPIVARRATAPERAQAALFLNRAPHCKNDDLPL